MELQVVLKEGKEIGGYGKQVVIWHIGLVLNDVTKYEEDSQLIVNVKMTVTNQPSVIEITQLLHYSDIVLGTPNLLLLQGKLVLCGSREETKLLDYEANIYYVQRV